MKRQMGGTGLEQPLGRNQQAPAVVKAYQHRAVQRVRVWHHDAVVILYQHLPATKGPRRMLFKCNVVVDL